MAQQRQSPWQQNRRYQNKNILTVEAVFPDEESAKRITREFQDMGQTVREVSLRHDNDGTPKVRITTSSESIPKVGELLTKMGQRLERAYSSANQGQSSNF